MDDTLKLRVHEFYLYFTKVWLQSDIQKWYEAANPMMLSTNNSLEANNNVLKRDYTGRMRLSMPNLVEKVKEMAEKWSKDPVKTVSREAEISLSLRKQAEGLLEEIGEFILIRTILFFSCIHSTGINNELITFRSLNQISLMGNN